MSRTIQQIPKADRELLHRCRLLNEDIEALHRFLPEQPKVIALLSRLNLDELPRDKRNQVRNILRGKELLDKRKTELNKIAVRGEKIAHRIAYGNFRSFAKLYCLDGLSVDEVARQIPCNKGTVRKYIKLLKESPENV